MTALAAPCIAEGADELAFPAEELERAVAVASRRAHAEVVDFTVAPRPASAEESRGGHDWLVEFAEPPRCPLEVFTRTLDEALMSASADYRARRAGGGLGAPRLVELPAGSFYRAMRQEETRDGQLRVARVAGDRTLAGRLLASAALVGHAPEPSPSRG